MAQQVVTELVIDANTAGADQFGQAMDKAGVSAQGMILAISGVSLAIVGVLTGMRSFVDYVGNTNKQLIDIGENARNAGLSTRQFQETLFAARAAGLTEKDFVSGLDRIGQDLLQASRGVTDFGKLFEANGLSIRDANGKLKDTKTALSDIAGLMQNATPQVQRAIAGIVGISKDWIPLLRDGAQAIEDQKRLAEDLGIVIDDATVQKAKEFDRQWRLAVAAWDSQFKQSLTELLPLMVRLAGYAIQILDFVGKMGGGLNRALSEPADMNSFDLSKTLDQVTALNDKFGALGDSASSFQKLKIETALGGAHFKGEVSQEAIDQYQDYLQDLLDSKTHVEPSTHITVGANGTKLPAIGGDKLDAVDRAINSLRRHTEMQLADARAIGQGAAAQAQFRAEAQLTAAVQANGGEITAEQARQFAELKERAMEAAEALARAKVQSDIGFGGQTGLLSQEDVQIAQQLKQLYPDVATALGSVEAQGLRLNTAMRGLSSSLESNLVSGLTDITTGSKSASQGFQDMSKAIVRAIEEMIIKITIITPLMRAMQGAFGSFGFGSLFGGSSSTLGLDGLAAVHHAGGTVGDGTDARYVHPAYFDFAPRYHTGGIAGLAPDEVPAILQRGERVIPRGQTGQNGVAINVQVINETGVAARTETTQAPNGDVTVHLKKMVEAIGVESIASGEMGRTITSKYGVKQFMGQ